MRIRLATDADLVAILRLWREGTSVVSHTDDPEGLRALLARDPEALLLAEEEGRLVGTLIAGWDGWRAWLYRLVVAPGVVLDHEHARAFWWRWATRTIPRRGASSRCSGVPSASSYTRRLTTQYGGELASTRTVAVWGKRAEVSGCLVKSRNKHKCQL
jgi:hypothetical protein